MWSLNGTLRMAAGAAATNAANHDALKEIARVDDVNLIIAGEVAMISDALYDVAFDAVGGSFTATRGEQERVVSAGWAQAFSRVTPDLARHGSATFATQDHVTSIAVALDGAHIAAVSTIGFSVVVAVFDREGTLRHQFTAREGEMRHHPYFHRNGCAVSVGFSEDGAHLIGAGMDKHVRVWSIANGSLVARLPLEAQPKLVAFTADELRVIGKQTQAFSLTDVIAGSLNGRYIDAQLIGHVFQVSGATTLEGGREETTVTSTHGTTYADGYEVLGVSEAYWAGASETRIDLYAVGDDAPRSVTSPSDIGAVSRLLFSDGHLFVIGESGFASVDLESLETKTRLSLPFPLLSGGATIHDGTLWVGAGRSVIPIPLDDPTGVEVSLLVKSSRLSPTGTRALTQFGETNALIDITAWPHRPVSTFEASEVRFSEDGSVVTAKVDSELRFLDAADGTLLGGIPMEDRWDHALDREGRVGCVGPDGIEVTTLSGETLLKAQGTRFRFGGGQVAVSDGRKTALYAFATLDRGNPEPLATVACDAVVPLPDGGHLICDETLRCVSSDGATRWEQPIAYAAASLSPCGRFLALTSSGNQLLSLASGEMLCAHSAHAIYSSVAATIGGELVTLGGEGSVTRTETGAERVSVERLADGLAANLRAHEEARRARDSAPLREITEALPSYAALPPIQRGDVVIFPASCAEDDHPSGGELHLSADRSWRYIYDEEKDQEVLQIQDGESNVLGTLALPDGFEAEIAPSGRYAIAKVDGHLQQMHRWDKHLNVDHEPDAEVSAVLTTFHVFGDRGEELSVIQPKTQGPDLEVESLRFAGDLVHFSVGVGDDQYVEVWNARSGTLIFSCEWAERAATDDALVLLRERDDGGAEIEIRELATGDERARVEAGSGFWRVARAGDGFALLGDAGLALFDREGTLLHNAPIDAREGALSADGERWESYGRAWDLRDGTPLHDHATGLSFLAGDEAMIASLDTNQEFIVRDRTGKVFYRDKLLDYRDRVAFGGGHVASVKKGALTLVELSSSRRFTCDLGCRDVALSRDALYILDSSATLRKVNLETRLPTVLRTFPENTQRLALGPRGETLLAWGQQSLFRIELDDDTETPSLTEQYLNDCAIPATDGESVAFVTDAVTVVPPSGEEHRVPGYDLPNAIAFDEEGSLFMARFDDLLVRQKDGSLARAEVSTSCVAMVSATQLALSTREGIEIHPRAALTFEPYAPPQEETDDYDEIYE